MRKNPHVFGQRHMMTDLDTAFGVQKNASVEKNTITNFKQIAEVKPDIFLRDECLPAGLKKMLRNQSAKRYGKRDDQA